MFGCAVPELFWDEQLLDFGWEEAQGSAVAVILVYGVDDELALFGPLGRVGSLQGSVWLVQRHCGDEGAYAVFAACWDIRA